MDNPLMNAAKAIVNTDDTVIKAKKYEFTGEVTRLGTMHEYTELYHIRRLSDGQLGGWIEKEENLSHEGDCWVGGNAMVYDNAKVCDNALVLDYARVGGNSRICDNACVYKYASVHNSLVDGHAIVSDHGHISGGVELHDHAIVCDKASVHGEIKISGNSRIECTLHTDEYACDPLIFDTNKFPAKN